MYGLLLSVLCPWGEEIWALPSSRDSRPALGSHDCSRQDNCVSRAPRPVAGSEMEGLYSKTGGSKVKAAPVEGQPGNRDLCPTTAWTHFLPTPE